MKMAGPLWFPAEPGAEVLIYEILGDFYLIVWEGQSVLIKWMCLLTVCFLYLGCGGVDEDSDGSSNKRRKVRSKRHYYIGEQSCRKCHKREYSLWKRGKHSRTTKILNSARARYISRRNGLGSAFGRRCTSCHATPGTRRTARYGAVGCQACHGPASGYRKHGPLKKQAYNWSRKRGMRPHGPSQKGCMGCHRRIRLRGHKSGRAMAKIAREYRGFWHAKLNKFYK